MQQISFGQILSYGQVAKNLNSAVSGACGQNPTPIIVPCHWVVGSGGRLGGYSGGNGLSTKEALLRLESVFKT
ncbi:MAG: MGMT family protein [Rhodospirillales bacterium]|jgi:methylated-DNA-[protein]-cysteine S-methyltransferase|nr:MGMT family protein [Rhodospirillales bacterium]